MKKVLIIFAFLATFAATVYLLINYTLWYLGAVTFLAVLACFLDKPITLAPDDPAFGS